MSNLYRNAKREAKRKAFLYAVHEPEPDSLRAVLNDLINLITYDARYAGNKDLAQSLGALADRLATLEG